VRVAYVTMYDAADTRIWSGTGHHIGKALESQGFELIYVGPLEDRGGPALSARRLLARSLGKRVLRERDPAVARGFAEQVETRLADLDVDWIFSPGTIPIAELSGTTPVAFWTDATFSQMIGLYPEFQRLAGSTIEAGNRLEKKALERASLAIYASDWAARSAIDDYGTDPGKVKVLPFGANLPVERTSGDIDRIIASRQRDLCRLLFVGVDWQRKGGDLALQIVSRLHDRDIRSELTIVGSTPEIPEKMRDLVNVVGFVSKNSPDGRATLEQLFAASHFLLMPSRAECFGVVFAEAASFGLPSIASNVGGIPSVVRNGLNGYTFTIGSVVDSATDRIVELWNDQPRYEDLCRSAFHDAQERLTWDAAGRQLGELLLEMHPSHTRLQPKPTSSTAARPRVSVVTVVRNGAAHIERAIQAVLGQTYSNLEYIVVDGASTDGTVDIIRRFEHRIDHCVSEPDRGIYDAMNKAIELVSDPEGYVLFANADDRLFSPDAIKNAIDKGGGADLIYGRMRLTDGDASAIMGREVAMPDLAQETLCHPATLMRRRLFDSVGRFDTTYRIAADYDLIVRCFQHPVSTRFVDEIISEMSMGGMSEDRFMLSCTERKRVVRARFDLPRRMAGVWQVNLYDIPRHAARRWLARAGLLPRWRALKRL
jgi:glycosyltransferase involved in cell wall biosynthesis